MAALLAVTGCASVPPGRITTDRMDYGQVIADSWKRQTLLNVVRLRYADAPVFLDVASVINSYSVTNKGTFSFGPHTVNLAWKVGGKLGANPLPRYDLFQWGGFLQLSGYRTGQLYGETIRYGRVMYYHRILKGSLLEGAYGGLSLEAGKVGNPLVPGNPDGLLKSASVFVGADSPVGPTYLGYGRTADGASAVYFFLGRPF